METILGLLIPFVGTTLGASCVLFMKKEMKPFVQKIFLGFASGVMVAAAVWSLLIPSLEMAEGMNKLAFIPAVVGFLIGMGFLLLMDRVIPHLHVCSHCSEGPKIALKKTTMLVLAVALHNLPEGLSAGAVFAGASTGSDTVTLAGAFALAIGIAIQNFPEGAIIAMPLRGDGMSRRKAFLMGSLSGLVEPVAGVVTLFLAGYITPVLPYLLSFAAGAMMYVVVEELIPEASEGEHSNIATVAFAIGFALMIVIDVVLG